MSTSVEILGFTLSQTAAFNSTGCMGGFFPIIYDLLNRQKTSPSEKIDLNTEFFLVKGLLVPLLALVITGVAVAFGNITTWLAALYLGASFPILVEKVIGASGSTVSNLGNGQ